MRIDTDDLERARGRKKVGRKHNHQPRGRALQRIVNHLAQAARERNRLRRIFNAKVEAYWRGERDGYPQ